MSEQAGSVTIQITANTTAFEAALARAKERATAFDAQISAQLNGAGVSEGLAKISAGVEQTNLLLAKLTTSGTAASAVMAKIGTATTATTAALSQVATATKLVNAEMASIGGSAGGAAALGAGTIAAKDFAAALEATGGNLGKITPAMLGLATANEEVAVTTKAAAVGMAELGVAETKAAGLGAGVTREFSVLGAEVLRGNFSRIPGSLIVLNERLVGTGAGVLTLRNGLTALGGLASAVFNPFTLGFLAISIGSEVAIKAFSGMKGSILDVNTVLENNKTLIDDIAKAYPEAAVAAKQYQEQANQIPKSIAAADLANQIAESRKTLSAELNTLRIDLHALGGEYALTGEAGSKAFEYLSGRVHDGTISAQALYSELGRLELDPKLSAEAHAFARSLEDAAKKAADLERSIPVDTAIATIVKDDAKAQHTLFEISSGFKDVGASASSADATIAKLFGTMNSGGGSGFGVTRSLAGQFGSQLTGQLQTTLGMFQQVDAAVQNARQDQLAGMVQLEAQFRATTSQVDMLKQAIATAAGKDNIDAFFGDVANIKDANAEIANATTTVNKLFAAMASGNTTVNAVYQGLDMVRQTLINDGFPVEKVSNFVDSLVRTNRELVADTGAAHQLNAAIQAIKDKTVNITVVTQQVGSGTKSIYDVPGGPVGVTRYNGQSDMTQQGYSVPSYYGGAEASGAGSSYGTIGGSSGVTVTRFGGARAAGGPIVPGMPYLVGEHGPEFVIPSGAGTVIPNGQSTALANPQSAFTGRDATAENNRYWTVLMNIEANTRKASQLLDEINAASKSSGSSLGGGSSSGSASTSQGDQLHAEFLKVLTSVRSNFKAAGIVGSGSIGYGSQALGASPEQIARSIVYGGQSSVGMPSGGSSSGQQGYTALHGGDVYAQQLAGMSPYSPGYAQAYAQALAAQNKISGFATGGIDSSDTQKVEFFKSPNEKVIIARPDQFADVRPGSTGAGSAGGNDNRPISFSMPIYLQGGAQMNKDSMAELRRQATLIVRDAVRSINGR